VGEKGNVIGGGETGGFRGVNPGEVNSQAILLSIAKRLTGREKIKGRMLKWGGQEVNPRWRDKIISDIHCGVYRPGTERRIS